MALRLRKEPLAFGFAAAAGVCAGLLVGPVLLPWGVPIGACGSLLLLSVGLFRESGHRELFYVLLVLAALDLGFLAANAPRTLVFLREFTQHRPTALRSLASQAAAEARGTALAQWLTMGVPVLVAAVTLARDVRRSVAAAAAMR